MDGHPSRVLAVIPAPDCSRRSGARVARPQNVQRIAINRSQAPTAPASASWFTGKMLCIGFASWHPDGHEGRFSPFSHSWTRRRSSFPLNLESARHRSACDPVAGSGFRP